MIDQFQFLYHVKEKNQNNLITAFQLHLFTNAHFVYKNHLGMYLKMLQCHFYTLQCHFYMLQCHFYTLQCHFYTLQCHFYTLQCHFYTLQCHFYCLAPKTNSQLTICATKI